MLRFLYCISSSAWTPINTVLALFLFNASCVSSVEDHVLLNSQVKEDGKYFPLVEQETASAKVIDNFEHKFSVSITRLTPALLQAMKERQRRLMQVEDLAFLPMASSSEQTSHFFLLSLFSPDPDMMDLTNKHIWTTIATNQLPGSPNWIAAKSIKRLGEKRTIAAYFPRVTQWTNEYLLEFIPSESQGQEIPKTFKLASLSAQVVLDFRQH